LTAGAAAGAVVSPGALAEVTKILNAQTSKELGVSTACIDDVKPTLLDFLQTLGNSDEHSHERRVQPGTDFEINDDTIVPS
jgi:hypothetical protein